MRRTAVLTTLALAGTMAFAQNQMKPKSKGEETAVREGRIRRLIIGVPLAACRWACDRASSGFSGSSASGQDAADRSRHPKPAAGRHQFLQRRAVRG